MRKNITKFLLLVIAFTFALSINYIFAAWTGPIQAPPGGNTPTPVHIGTTNQVKDGGLGLNALSVFGNGYFQDNVGIGIVSPQAKLDVAGKIKVGDDSVSPTAGTIRWTGSDLEVYDGSVWKSLTSGDTTIITSDVTDCNNFGGNWVDSQGVCYFPAAGECPSGWTQKESYSSTQGNTCAGKSCLGTYGNDIYGTSCSTGSHFRTNKDKEDCAYMSINEFEAQYGNCSPKFIECLATQTEVGCVKTKPSGVVAAVTINIDASITMGQIRSFQAVNGGPATPFSGIMFPKEYLDMGIDLVRNHGALGPTDIDVIFPNFNADPNDPGNYNFKGADRYIKTMKDIGADIFFRLGYGWRPKVKYIPLKEHDKWAEIAKHIVMHYNGGWANGFNYDIKYWEVWNEPNNDIDTFWSGTDTEFYKLYETTAKKIKQYDPSLKIGGPALAIDINRGTGGTFAKGFMDHAKLTNSPLDFFSFHVYPYNPVQPSETAKNVRSFLNTAGFPNSVELVMSEWNLDGLYTAPVGLKPRKGITRDLTYSAFMASSYILMQDSEINKAIFFSGDEHGFLGIFEQSTYAWKKPAYVFKSFKDIKNNTPIRIKSSSTDTEYAVLAGMSSDNKQISILISNFQSPKEGFNLNINNIPLSNRPVKYERYVLDENRNFGLIESGSYNIKGSFVTSEDMVSQSVQLIKLFF
ncbi:hypothetical protein A2Z61_00015 [Candidatus Campbellbacteria bacterium RIFCSPLOWO2_02_35_12]|uniref:Glycosyl hydrolases family 39 N-terminal catalytic domain-containing protein n=1 Tax=Candidatus Campbellbacteria bacterium RIFCSPLOWO2_02_35_12 TaxID=1797580 RepID=A0A1F5EK09_9BACT|nr:MAG: hypothetical protein A2Z61_00015 [Candidatus Campbellbacteria bacterium RIFCSPLOWO2_02_35_12]